MKLYYFDVYGRAEAIRMALTKAGVAFEDKRITGEDFTKLKAENPDFAEFGQMPVLEKDGKFYSQSTAILRMVCLENGFYPKDPVDSWKVESMNDSFVDVMNPIFGLFFNPTLTEEEKGAKIVEMFKAKFPPLLNKLEARLKSNSSQKHLVGDSWTIIDF